VDIRENLKYLPEQYRKQKEERDSESRNERAALVAGRNSTTGTSPYNGAHG
jgi:hypothetical protein